MSKTIKELRADRLQYLEITINENVKHNIKVALEAIREKVNKLSYDEALLVTLKGRNISINLEQPIAMDWVDSDPEFAGSTYQLNRLFTDELIQVLASEGMRRISVFELLELVQPASHLEYDIAWSI